MGHYSINVVRRDTKKVVETNNFTDKETEEVLFLIGKINLRRRGSKGLEVTGRTSRTGDASLAPEKYKNQIGGV